MKSNNKWREKSDFKLSLADSRDRGLPRTLPVTAAHSHRINGERLVVGTSHSYFDL